MKLNPNKYAQLGAVHCIFKHDVLREHSCFYNRRSAKQKKILKRIAARATRNFVKRLSVAEFKDLLEE